MVLLRACRVCKCIWNESRLRPCVVCCELARPAGVWRLASAEPEWRGADEMPTSVHAHRMQTMVFNVNMAKYGGS
jgi:hypothetical protein